MTKVFRFCNHNIKIWLAKWCKIQELCVHSHSPTYWFILIYISIHEYNRPHSRSLNTCTFKFIQIQDHSIQQFLYLFSNSCPFNNFISIQQFYFHLTMSNSFRNKLLQLYSHIHNGNWTECSAIWSEIIRVISNRTI